MDLGEALAADLHDAFPALVRGYGGAVYSTALRLCGPGPAEDIAQETFAKAYAALGRYEPERVRTLELRPWVLTIALNVARNHLRARTRHPEVQLDRNGQGSAPDGQTAADLRAVLGDALLRLPLPTRQAVVLRHVVGCSTAEVAAILDRPTGTVKSQVARGLAALRDHLEDR
jgi:RNA polymerase sigma factor (sigma-70 family)